MTETIVDIDMVFSIAKNYDKFLKRVENAWYLQRSKNKLLQLK